MKIRTLWPIVLAMMGISFAACKSVAVSPAAAVQSAETKVSVSVSIEQSPAAGDGPEHGNFALDRERSEGTRTGVDKDVKRPATSPPPPPMPAILACAERPLDAGCKFIDSGLEVSGRCERRSTDAPAACAPPPSAEVLSQPDKNRRVDESSEAPHRTPALDARRSAGVKPSPSDKPPVEAVNACTARREGSPCSFGCEGGVVRGHCRAGQGGGRLACALDGLNRMETKFGPPPGAILVCAEKPVNAECRFRDHTREISGRCKRVSPNAPAACAPVTGGPESGPSSEPGPSKARPLIP